MLEDWYSVRVTAHREIHAAQITVTALTVRRQSDYPSKHSRSILVPRLGVVELAQPVVVRPVVGMEVDRPLVSALGVRQLAQTFVSQSQPAQGIVAIGI